MSTRLSEPAVRLKTKRFEQTKSASASTLRALERGTPGAGLRSKAEPHRAAKAGAGKDFGEFFEKSAHVNPTFRARCTLKNEAIRANEECFGIYSSCSRTWYPWRRAQIEGRATPSRESWRRERFR